jgi:hypothetical protein
MAAFRNYILLFSLVAGTIIAGPINVQDGDSKCARTCTESLSDNSKFQYTPGTTYTYRYDGTTETKLQGSSSQLTSLKIQATADIEVLSKCEFALKLSDVSLTENGQTSSESGSFSARLEANPLRFAFQDGVIEDVCSMSGEDERVLNIKRGILSTFQNSMAQLDKKGTYSETDISGTCPTTYSTQTGIFEGHTITKTKDILACTDRNGNISSIHSKRYLVPSKIQNVPLLKTTYSCTQNVKSGKVEKTTCTEVHMFRPFSKGDSGAVTTATQTLTYSTYKNSISTNESPVQRRSSLLFHHVYDESIDADAKSQVIETLQQICSEVGDEITKNTPILFGTLISHMKRLSADKMMQVYTSVNGDRICSNQRGKQFFFDAIPMVATEASLSLTQKLISEKVVQGAEAEMWLTQLAFIPRPTYSMLTAIKPLLNDDSVKTRALLGVSAMVHKLCDNNADCQRHPEVADFVSMLNANIGSKCESSTPEQRNSILVTLKAFGNAGDAVTSSSIIGRCITNRDVDNEIRVAALQASRRMPCSVSREDAMRLFQNPENDAELRIHAFKAVMVCPSNEVLTKVRMMLSGETVNQVGSYVWTYLENLKETSSPLRQELASILEDAKLREDFNCDVRKFSRNVEKSFFSEYLNAGAQVESDLIWSQKSYIPRSAMLNVTVEMFGNSINLVEVGGRVQGLERIVEKFFGPDGYFSKKNTQELMDNKRQTANYVSSFDGVFKTPDDKIMTSMYVKMFGNDMGFAELDSDDWAKLQDFNLLDFLIKLAEPKKIDITRNYQFLDSSLIVPTCVGLPMNLTVNGTASVSLDVDGNIDLRNFAASPRNLDIKGHIKPSAAVVVSGLMGVDALVTKSTMKMVATMHTSTMIDGKIQLQNGQVFNVELNTPQEKMEIFHVQTEFYMNGNEMRMPEPAKTIKKCSPSQVTKVIGMEMCVDVTLPHFSQDGLPAAPFTGPMNVQLFVEKKDTHTGYTFTAKYENERQQVSGATYTRRLVHVSLDTPGSQVNRKMLAEALFDPAAMKATAELDTPWRKFSWITSFENTVTKKSASTVMKIDETQEYSVNAELGINEKRVKTVFTPSLAITMPNKPTMTIDGTIEMGTGKTVFAVDMAMKKFTRKPITLRTELKQERGGESYDAMFKLDSDMLTADVTGAVTMSSGNYNGNAALSYKLAGRPLHRFSTFGKFMDKSRGDMKSYSVQAGFVPTEFPEYAFSVDTDLTLAANHVSSKLDIVYSQEHKLYLTHETTKQGDWSALKVDSKSTFKYPMKNIDMAATFNHEHNSNEMKCDGSVTYAPGQTVRGTLNLDRKTEGAYNGEVTLSYPGRDASLRSELRKLADGEHKMTVNAKWNNDADSQVSMTSSYKPGATHEITADLKIPGYPITVTASVKPNLKDFMARSDVTYKRDRWSTNFQYRLGSDDITSSLSYVCPHRTVTYEMSAQANSRKVSGNFDLKWDAERDSSKKVLVTMEYNNADQKRDGKVTFTSPLGSYAMSSDLELHGEKDVELNFEYEHGNTKCTLNTRLSPRQGQFSLSSPYIMYGPVQVLNGRYSVNQDNANAEFSWNPSSKITVDGRMSADQYKLEMTTPFDMAKTMELTVNMPSSSGRFSVDGKMNTNSVTMSVAYPDFRSGEFELKYGGNTVGATFSQNGDIAMFNGESTLTWNEKRIWSKLEMDTKNPITVSLDITTPFKYRKMSAKFNHRGELMNFRTGAALTWNNEQVKGTITFTGKQAELNIITPWRNVDAEYTFTGEPKSFTAKSSFKWAEDQQMKAEMTFDITNDFKVTFGVSSPFYSTVTGELSHSGSWSNFRNKATLTYAPEKTFEFSTMFSKTSDMEFNADVKWPMMTVKVSGRHSGDIRSWKNSASLTVGDKQPITAFTEFDSNKYYGGKAGFKNMPFETLRNGEASFEHKVFAAETITAATVTWNENKSINGGVTVSMKNGYSLTATFTSPFTNDLSLTAAYSGNPSNFENTVTAQWAPSKTITVTTTLDMRSGFDAKMKMDTPWRQVSFSANQQGNANEFSASATLSWEAGKHITSSLEFSKVNEIRAQWSLTSSFKAVEDMKVVLTHRGTSYNKFYNQLEGRYNGQEAKFGTTWDMTNGVSLEVNCINPWKNFNAEYKFNGKPMDFSTNAELKYDENTFSGDLKFEMSSTVTITANLKPVFFKPMSTNIVLSKTNNRAMFSWGDNKSIIAEVTLGYLEDGKNINGEASFTTPFRGFESGRATFSHNGNLESFSEKAEVTFNTKTSKFECGFTSFGDLKGDFSLSSPWYNANGNFKHSGDRNKFENEMELTYAAGNTISASTKWNLADSRALAEFDVRSPFKSFNGKYNHQYSTSNGLNAHVEAACEHKEWINSDLSYSHADGRVRAAFSATTPWKSINAKYTLDGKMTDSCTTVTEFGWDGQKQLSLECTISLRNGFFTTVTANTPWKNFRAEVDHKGAWSNFQNKVSVTYETGKTIQLDTELKLTPEFFVKAALSSPMKNAEFSYRHTGTLDNFSCHLEGNVDGQTVNGDLTWKMRSGVDASLDLRNPWKNIKAAFKTNDDWKNLESSAEFQLDSDRFESNLTFNMKSGSVTVQTPWRVMTSRFNFNGDLKNFDSNVMVSWESGKQISGEASFSSQSSNRNGMVKLTTPWKTLSANYQSSGEIDNFDSAVDFSWETGKTVKLEVRSNMRTEKSFDVKLATPWRDMSAEFKHEGTYDKFTTKASASWESGKTISAELSNNMSVGYMNTEASVMTPWRNLSAKYTRTGTAKKFDAETEFSWETGKKIATTLTVNTENGYDGTVKIESPWKNLEASAKFAGDMTAFDTSFNFKWETDKSVTSRLTFNMMPMSGTWTYSCPHHNINASFSHNGDGQNMKSEASFTYDGKPFTFTSSFDRRSGYHGSVRVTIPSRELEAKFNHQGDFADFRNDGELSWETGKRIQFASNFKLSPKLTGFASLKTPFYNDMEAGFEHSGTMTDFQNSAFVSWAPSKKMEVSSNFKKAATVSGAASLKTPFFDNMDANFEHTCDMTNFNNRASFSWGSNRVEATSHFNKGSTISGAASLKTPFYDDMDASFEHSGEMTDFNNRASFTYGSKKVEVSSNFKKAATVSGAASLKTPFYDDMDVSFEHSGEMTDFNNRASFTYGSKKVEASSNFKKAATVSGAASLKTPFSDDMDASFEHSGEMTDFNNRASFTYGSKKVEASSNFKKAATVSGAASLKTPFYDDMDASFEHTGEMTNFNNRASFTYGPKKMEVSSNFKYDEKLVGAVVVETPFFDTARGSFDLALNSGKMSFNLPKETEVEYTFTDKLNWKVEANYGDKEFKAENNGSFNNGFQCNTEVSTPFGQMKSKLNHEGDYKKFSNSVELSWNEKTVKMMSEFDLANRKASQSLELPVYKKMEWSGEYSLSENSLTSDLQFAYGEQKVELQLGGNVEWKKYRTNISGSATLKTPFAGYEDNMVKGSFSYSGRLIQLETEGFMGTSANTKKFEVYFKNTGTSTRDSASGYMKTTLYSNGESESRFEFSHENGVISAEVSNDLKFHEPSKFSAKLSVEHSRTSSSLNHSGSLVVNCGAGEKKLVWNAGSNSQMCETGFTYTVLGRDVLAYQHKTTWTSSYDKLTHDMTFKSQFEHLKDCEFKVTYDFTQPKKTVEVTMFNDPSKPFDFKLECDTTDNIKVTVVAQTPFDSYKNANFDLSVNKASQPYNVKVEGSLNGQTFASEGRLRNSGNGVFDTSLTFTSQMPAFENLQLSINNAAFDGQIKPHVVAQWATDKKVEFSATVSWTNGYKVNIDLATPFDKLRSLVTDVTIANELMKKFDLSFTFKTNQMRNNLSGQMKLNVEEPSLSVTASSPFESFRTFELSASLMPTLSALVKCNGKTWFNLNGRGQFESWKNHSLEFTATYPFWNEYMHFKVNNDLSLSERKSLSVNAALEYLRGQEMTLTFDLKTAPTTSLTTMFTSPFEKFENIKYSLQYDGVPSRWSENTEFEFYYGKITTSTSFSMEDGIAFHQAVNGDMKNGWQSFSHKEDFVFTGYQKFGQQFDIQYSMSGSILPTVSFETSWKHDTMDFTVKATYYNYQALYVHKGGFSDFSCQYEFITPLNKWNGNWSVKKADRLTITATLKCPHREFNADFDSDFYNGRFNGSWRDNNNVVVTFTNRFSRTASPFRFEKTSTLETAETKLSSDTLVTEERFSWSLKSDNEEVFALRAQNSQNADMEYKPSVEVVIKDVKYEFDGLYKNEGTGYVRDFKLHMNGPKNTDYSINMQLELKTMSEQLVPGSSKMSLSYTGRDGSEKKLLDLTSEWGNDRAVIIFNEPRPMKYAIDFSVDTKGQNGEILANWDTTTPNKNFKMTFSNKYVSYSRRMRSIIDIDVVYADVSRGFTSSLDWTTKSFSHKLTFDYNGKEIGYDFTHSHESGCQGSLELISEWRNVKGTWSNVKESNAKQLGFEFYWDSARDATKKVSAVSRWEETSTNTYKWTTTFSHPALTKDFVITDTIAYDTSKYYFSFTKNVSFSTDSSKDVKFGVAVEKDGKWGVELKQDFNKVDLRLGTEFSGSDSNTFVMYKGTDGRMKNFNLKTTSNAFELVTPMKTLRFEFESTRTTYTFSMFVDGRKYQAVFTLRPDDSYLLVQFSDPADKSIKFESMKITNGYQMQVVKTEGARTVTEGLAAFSVSENKTVNGKLYWNPTLYSEVKSKLAAVRSDIRDALKRVSSSSTREAGNRVNSLNLGSDFDQIMPHYQREADQFGNDFQTAKLSLNRAYNDDVFLMKSIDEATGSYVRSINEQFTVVSAKMMEFYNQYVEPGLMAMGENAEKVKAELVIRLAKIEENIASLNYLMGNQWSAKTEQIGEAVEAVKAWLKSQADRVTEYVQEHPSMKSLNKLRTLAIEKLTSASDAAYSKVSSVIDANTQVLTKAISDNKLSEMVSSGLLKDLANTLSYKLQFYYGYYDVSDNVKVFLQHLKNVATEYATHYINHYVDEAVNNFKWKEYNLDNGRVEFEFTIPTSFNTAEFARLKTNLMERLDTVVKHMSKYHFNWRETFYMYKPQGFDQILPPFNAQAIIAGQHIRTFDRRHYDFSSGECSYLLARDFQDGNFTIFVNYNGQEQSLTVHSNGLTFDIMHDNTVKMNGAKIELPVQYFDTSIIHLGHKIRITSTLGVEVECDNDHGLCTVEMSGYYFAKTGGLFGTYDNEPADDFTMSNNRNTSDVVEFANSWTSSCTGRNTAQTFTATKGTKEYEACAAVFMNSASAMSPCFGVVDPEAAFHNCITDMSKDVTLTSKNGPCKAVKFYQAECEFAGISVSEPKHCVSCQMGDAAFGEGESTQLSEPVLAADIVFVVEEKMCNDNTDSKLPQLSKYIKSALNGNHYSDIRYGLVGFGGEGVHDPNHIHTMASKMFGAQNEFSLGTQALRFGEGKNTDVFGAVEFAAQYPFIAGATKIIILIPCSVCGMNILSYRSLSARLVNENIKLHVMNKFSYEITVEGKNPETNYLFGIDNTAVFSMRDARRLKGNSRLYDITTKPNDYCSSLALQTGGTVFDLNMMTQKQSSTIKSFQTVFANRLALTTYPSSCSVCSCEYNELFQMARSVCKKC